MRSFALSSFLFLLFFGCASPYRHLKYEWNDQVNYPVGSLTFQRELYRCTVDGKFLFKKFHLSGILFFKKREDTSTRIIFQNEMGYSFFDFKWSKQNEFSVVSIIDQLNKPAVIKILRKDFDMFLVNLNATDKTIYRNSITGKRYYAWKLVNGLVFYITDEQRDIESIQNWGKHKKVTEISIAPSGNLLMLPDSIFIKHYQAHFTINLTKIHEEEP